MLLIHCVLLLPWRSNAQVPPVINTQPKTQYGTLGLGAQFSVSASGSSPLNYQWVFNGTELAGATRSTLQLTNLQWSEAGMYQVVITNNYGSLTSSNAVLAVGPLAFWGQWQTYIRTNPPLDLTNALQVSSGGFYGLALRPDGTLAAWGADNNGVVSGATNLTNVVSTASTAVHSLALLGDGRVVAWGGNNFGQTNVPKNLTNVVQVAAGGNCSMALRADGSISVWGGETFNGQTNVPGGLKAVAIGAGQSHCAALTAAGSVVAWGNNTYGQTAVPTGLTGVVSLAVGPYHTMALKADGTVATWGYQNSAQTNVPPEATNVVAVASGQDFDLALRRDGTVIAWGSTSSKPSPTDVPVGLTNVFFMAAGGPCAFGLRNSGEPFITSGPATQTVWSDNRVVLYSRMVGAEPLTCQWQWNDVDIPGATNFDFTLDSAQPYQSGRYTVQYSNTLGVVTSKVAIVTVRPQLTVATWGTPGGSYSPGISGLSNLVAIAGGFVLRDDGQLVRWTTNYNTAPPPPQTLSNVVAIAYGGGSSYLALKGDGQAVFWTGPGYSSSFTNNSALNYERFTAVAAGGDINLGLRSDGTVYQWKDSMYASIPPPPSGLTGVVAIAVGLNHCLALKSDGTVSAWGSYAYGPATVPPGVSNVVAIASGYDHDVALRADGTVTAWGDLSREATNVPPGLSNVVAISAGGFNNLALRADGSLAGWGDNYYGLSDVPQDLTEVRALPLGGVMNVALTAKRAPCVSSPPRGLTTSTGTTATLSVWNSGTPPFAYQWYRDNGQEIPNATNQILVLNHLQAADAGQYAVVVTNSFGVTTSRWATVTAGAISSWPVAAGTWVEPVPPGLVDPTMISCGPYHSVALRSDGTVTGWNEPSALAPADLDDVVSLAAGQEFTVALRRDGTVRVWAAAGNQYDTNPVPGLVGVKAIAAGSFHAVALKSDSTVISWFVQTNGFNLGQTTVPPGLSNVVAIAAGDTHSLALKSDGTLVAWGSQPSIPAGLSNVVAIAASFLHNLALRSDNSVVSWGWSSFGLNNPPLDLTNAVGIGAGRFVNMACRSDGTVSIWGDYTFNGGELPDGLGNVYAVSAGVSQIVALTGDGRPIVTVQPFDQFVATGRDASFVVMAAGARPLTYQWQFNGDDLPGGTNAVLKLSKIAAANQGTYRCVITNLLGSAVSAPAQLSVTAAPVRFDFAKGGVQVTNGFLQVSLTGLSGTGSIVLLSSTNLVDWIPVYTNAPSQGTWEYLDEITSASARFYRAVELGP